MKTANGIEFKMIYSIVSLEKMFAIMSVSRMVFITLLMAIAVIFFQRTSTNLVLYPIERMLEKVKLIARNPLAAAQDEEVEMAGVMTMMHKEDLKKGEKETGNLETVMLEAAITKIGHLLALGFGEAGSAIIANNMTGDGDLDPMVVGQRTYAIFGFCDIRHFADNTDVLQTNIMTFVNQIAEITHS